MPRIFDLLKENDPRDLIHQVVQALAEGETAALPLDGDYAIAALASHAQSTSKLESLNLPKSTGCLVFSSVEAAADYLPPLSQVQRRLLQRCWPGPIVFRFPEALSHGLGAELPAPVRRMAAPDGELQVMVTASQAIQDVLWLLPAPLVLRIPTMSQDESQESDLSNWLVGTIHVFLNAGPVTQPGNPTIVRVSGDNWTMERTGLIDASYLREATCDTFLFVCTGNTCRSPMAAALFRKLLSARLQCREDELVARGYRVLSAGLSATHGMPASPEAVELVEQLGGDLERHRSQPLTSQLLEQADYVFTMTSAHRATILQHHPELAARVGTLSGDGSDVSDPIGQGFDEYQRCVEQISQYLEQVLDRLSI